MNACINDSVTTGKIPPPSGCFLRGSIARLTFDRPVQVDVVEITSAGAIDGGRSAHQAKRDSFRKLKDMLKQEADYVANVAKGDAQLILDGGYEVRAERKPSHLPVAPASLEALTPDVTNAVKIEWKGERTVRLYQVQMSTTDPAGTPVWNTVALTSKRQHTVENLEPYRLYWFRVIAVNVAGESLPSDILMARAA